MSLDPLNPGVAKSPRNRQSLTKLQYVFLLLTLRLVRAPYLGEAWPLCPDLACPGSTLSRHKDLSDDAEMLRFGSRCHGKFEVIPED